MKVVGEQVWIVVVQMRAYGGVSAGFIGRGGV